MNDSNLLKGLSSIVNNDNVKPDIDIVDLENSMIADGMGGAVSVEKNFKNELEKYANELDIDFTSEEEPPPLSQLHQLPQPQQQPQPKTEFEMKTEDQKKYNQINDVINEMGGKNESFDLSIDKEREEEAKTMMLEEIDSLKTSLMEDNINIDRIPTVDQSSSYEEITTIHKILRLKNDRMRYCSFAEEFLLFGAHGMEELFDGKRVWFGHYSPDLTGWHNQVQVKLRRMRHDTSTIVSDIMQDYNIGPGFRILLELVPSLFMYNRNNKQRRMQNKEYSRDSLSESMDRIRDIE